MRRHRRTTTIVVAAAALLLVPFAAADPPAVSITSGPSNPTSATTASFGFSVDDPLAIVECSLDGGGFSLCGSGVSYSGLGDGTHTFVVRATNLLLETGSDSQSWAVDNTGPSFSPPDIVVDVNDVTTSPVSFNPGASDPHGATVSCSPPSGSSFPLGTNTVSCTATDSLGNTTSDSFTVTVRDVIPPTVTTPGTTTVSVNGVTAAAVSFTVTASAGTPSCSPASGSSFPLGTTLVTCTATDAAGNTGSASFNVVVRDTTAPTVSITGGPTGTAASTATFSFTTNEGALACSLDSAGFAACSSPVSLSGLASGAHTFRVRATDGSSNVGNASRAWTVDATPPTFTAPTSLVVEANGRSGTVVTYTVTAADAGVPLLPGAVSCSPASQTLFPLGTRNVQCTAADALGNTGTVTFGVLVRDTTPPTLTAADISLAATSAEGVRRTDPAMRAFLASLRGSDLVSGVEITTNAPAVFPIGKTPLLVRAVDGAKNATVRTVTVTVLPRGQEAPPPPDLDPPADVTQLRASAKDHGVTLTWVTPNAPDLDAIIVRMAESRGSAAERVVSRAIRATATASGLRNGAEYRFVVTTVDKAGNESRGVVVLATPKAVLLVSPKPGTKVSKPPLLRWAPTPSAAYYNIQLYRGKVKVLSAWPTRARIQLGRTWMFEKSRRTLGRGAYTWYVWPGFGARVAVKYGPMIGKSTFVVVAPKSDL